MIAKILIAVACCTVAACESQQGVRYWHSDSGAEPSDGDEHQSAGPPEPYALPLSEAPECELSADCPAGLFCDLGQCYQQCTSVTPCSDGFVCNGRGLCVASESDSSDAPITTQPVAQVAAKAEAVSISSESRTVALEFTANGDEEVRYRLDSRVPWLRAKSDRGAFKHALTLEVEVDVSKRPAGETSGTVELRTSCGDVRVRVDVEQALSGVYKGSLVYESPRELGRVPFMLDVVERDHGFFNVRIRPEGSPTFPAEQGKAATFSARLENGVLAGLLQKIVHPADLGPTRTALTHDLGHEVTFSLDPSRGGLSGTFEERWIALLPSDQRTKGRVMLRRVAGELPAEFSVSGVPVMPSPVRPTPMLDAKCITAVTCSGAPSNWEAARCGDRALEAGAVEITSKKLVVPGESATGYVEWGKDCAEEWDEATSDKSAMECVRPSMLECAHELYTYAFMKGASAGYAGVMEVASRRAGIALLIADESVVNAYALPYEDPEAATPNKVLGIFDEAHRYVAETLRASFDPFLLQSMYDMPTSAASGGDFLAFRRFAQLLGRMREITENRLALMRRGASTSLDDVRATARTETMNLLIGAIALTGLIQKHAVPTALEWSFLDGIVTRVAAQTVDLESLDALGLPKGYVPYIYDAHEASPQKSTNLDFLVEQANVALSLAAADEKAADEAYEAYENTVEDLQTDLLQLKTQTNSELADICGYQAGSLEPNTDACETGAGLLGQAVARHGAAAAAVEVAVERIEELHQRVEIQTDRVEKIDDVNEDLIAFTKNNQERINAKKASADQAGLARGFLSNLSFMNGASFGSSYFVGSLAMGPDLLERQIEDDIRELQQMQELKLLESQKKKEYIDGMTVIRELLISEAGLVLEMRVSALQAVAAELEVQHLLDRKRAVELEYELFKDVKVESLANRPLLRVLKQALIRKALASRENAVRWAYLAGLGFEFELNVTLPGIRERLLPALRTDAMTAFLGCISNKQAEFDLVYSPPETRADEISVRRDVLGILGSRTDDVTGEELNEGEQFRRRFFQPSNVTANGSFVLQFATSVDPGNGVWSTGLCNDQLRTVELKLVGDGLGDHQATIRLTQTGTAVQRSCDAYREGAADVLRQYTIGNPKTAEVQAGVNAYGPAPSSELYGRSVAATDWTLTIPPASQAPRNRDLEPELIDDIVIRVQHDARTLSDGPAHYDPSCH